MSLGILWVSTLLFLDPNIEAIWKYFTNDTIWSDDLLIYIFGKFMVGILFGCCIGYKLYHKFFGLAAFELQGVELLKAGLDPGPGKQTHFSD